MDNLALWSPCTTFICCFGWTLDIADIVRVTPAPHTKGGDAIHPERVEAKEDCSLILHVYTTRVGRIRLTELHFFTVTRWVGVAAAEIF